MPKANKTQKTTASVSAFLNSIEDDQKRTDCKAIAKIMQTITGHKPKMWGTSMVGFDSYHYVGKSGREGDWFCIGFSPRKANITVYIMPGYQDFGNLMKKLGPHSTGKSCLYFKRLSDLDPPTLKKIIAKGYRDLKKMYP